MKPELGYRVFFVFLALISFIVAPISVIQADTQAQIDQKNQEIEQLQQQIDQLQQQLGQIHSETLTYQNQVAALTAQINQKLLILKSLTLSISQTNNKIQTTQSQISDAETQIAKDQAVLAQYLALLYQSDQESLTTILLQNDNLSDFFNDLNSVKTNQDNLQTTLDSIQQLKASLEGQKQDLEDTQSELQRQQGLAQAQKRELDQDKSSQTQLLKNSQGKEATAQQKLNSLKQELYYLEQNGVTVDDAIKYGNLAALAVGIRPAFLLAEMDHESAILDPSGGNVGNCYVKNFTNGDGVRISTGAYVSGVMKPSRDIQPYLSITSSLGIDPANTRVSCPTSGYGGAMGPAQFIPSTWMGYTAGVSQITGHNPANPWNIQDAFTAAATKFANDGANSKTTDGEIAASRRYYCGSAVRTSRMSNATWNSCVNYANAVQNLAAQLEQNL